MGPHFNFDPSEIWLVDKDGNKVKFEEIQPIDFHYTACIDSPPEVYMEFTSAHTIEYKKSEQKKEKPKEFWNGKIIPLSDAHSIMTGKLFLKKGKVYPVVNGILYDETDIGFAFNASTFDELSEDIRKSPIIKEFVDVIEFKGTKTMKEAR